MKTYKKPLARIIELETEGLLMDTSDFNGLNEKTTEAEQLTNSYRKKLWED